ncbi:bifunctional phosphoglucose/phosphomannose isomerase [Thermosyntropha lipolytica DSM 11003]|uniref:Bifunctional phosphoglucose/phosphomannose isomerase n=1 Tax=Thermosyntropha lipolytica DSM 11003 TaxID=1123382 RepID=A0A1M5KKZ2_9FIRM|nr:bifunctional phosphoglucose/phosphomannose isomerase [Thermosyntropha lipolytica]SHG53436.1 bifunctional phosphoglucose/phosphomannose isomerase [Thermosyntropha lipolytica DSM 11003]
MSIMTAEKMLDYLYGLPEQFVKSREIDLSFLERYRRNYKAIVVSGLGGSAIGGDILRSYAADKMDIPVIVNRGYELPNFVNRDTLFLAVSYSGNTEETISAYEEARRREADIICVTSGGKLEELAGKDGYGVIKVPSGLVPRAAIGYLFCPLLLVLGELKILPRAEKELEETIEILSRLRDELRPELALPANKARYIAEELRGALPVIWGTTGVSEVAAMRFKAQINENAKSPAYYNIFPELNHNEIVGFEVPDSVLSGVVVVILEDEYDHPRIKKRIEITSRIVEDKVKNIIRVKSRGDSFLARLFSLIYIGDYASVYLAMDYGINPTPVAVIDYLKAELARV